MVVFRGMSLYRDCPGTDPTWAVRTLEITSKGIWTLPDETPAEIGGYLIPGLVDVHAHIGLTKGGAASSELTLRQARADRDSGVLLVRDCGIPVNADNSFVKADPELPKIINCGAHLALPKRYIRYYALELNSPNELPEAVAEQARRSDGWVKLVADWIDRSDGANSDLKPLWSAQILRDAMAAAHENGARVTAHAFSHSAITPLLEAGVDCIEHGTGMDADQITEAAAQGIPVTPTVLQVDRFADFAEQAGDKYPVYGSTMQQMWQRRREQEAALYDAGVQLLPGTDSGGYQRHGSLPSELQRWPQLGIPVPEVIDLATWRVRDFLGFPSLADGNPADLVIYDRDPRENVAVLTGPKHVYLDGVPVSGALKGE
ncbi:MAG: amidohydrolase family protein [Varibaculum sp.]|nr:amidohydrolase family protein [Varibaculum sp.]